VTKAALPDLLERNESAPRAAAVHILSKFLFPLTPLALSGCSGAGAPSYVIVGSYFPGWMFCALLGIVAAIVARVGFVASGLADILPFQLFVCAAAGLSVALLVWLLWFGA
jgi:hypothetical protein